MKLAMTLKIEFEDVLNCYYITHPKFQWTFIAYFRFLLQMLSDLFFWHSNGVKCDHKKVLNTFFCINLNNCTQTISSNIELLVTIGYRFNKLYFTMYNFISRNFLIHLDFERLWTFTAAHFRKKHYFLLQVPVCMIN